MASLYRFASGFYSRKLGVYILNNSFRFITTNSNITASKTFKKLSVVKLTNNFAEATKVVEVALTPPDANQVLVKNIYAGVNATDINITAGRLFTDGKLPFDIGFEVSNFPL
jgi:hypothetical protein